MSDALFSLLFFVGMRYWLPGFVAAFFGYTLGTLFGLLLSLFWLLPKAYPGYRFSFFPKYSARSSLTSYSLVNYAADQFQRTPDTVLPLAVINLFGPSVGAHFFVVWTLGRSVASLAGSIGESLFAEGSNNPSNISTDIWRSIRLGLVLACVLALAMIVGSPLILSIYGREYREQGDRLLYGVAVAAIPSVLMSILVSVLRIRDRLRAVLTIVILTNVVGIASTVAVMTVAFSAAGIGWLIGQILVLALIGFWWRWDKTRIMVDRLERPQTPG